MTVLSVLGSSFLDTAGAMGTIAAAAVVIFGGVRSVVRAPRENRRDDMDIKLKEAEVREKDEGFWQNRVDVLEARNNEAEAEKEELHIRLNVSRNDLEKLRAAKDEERIRHEKEMLALRVEMDERVAEERRRADKLAARVGRLVDQVVSLAPGVDPAT